MLVQILNKVLVLALLAALVVTVLAFDPSVNRGVADAITDTSIDRALAANGLVTGCSFYEFPAVETLPAREKLHRLGFYAHLAQYGYKFKVDAALNREAVPWRLDIKFMHCSPYAPGK